MASYKQLKLCNIMGESKLKQESLDGGNVVTMKPAAPRQRSSRRQVRKPVIFLPIIVIVVVLLIHWHDDNRAKNNVSTNETAAQVNIQAANSAKNTQVKINDLLSAANLFIDQNQPQDAIAAYKQVVALMSNNQQALMGLGNEYFSLKDSSEAVTYFTKAIAAIKADPKSPYADELSYLQEISDNAKQSNFTYPAQTQSGTNTEADNGG